MKSRQSKQIFRTKKRMFDLAVAVFALYISIVSRTKFLSHDLNAFWCVRLPSRDAKSMLNVANLVPRVVLESTRVEIEVENR